jgi:hypothetical protein
MAPPTSRTDILTRLRRQISDGKRIVGAGAGILPSSAFSSEFYYCLQLRLTYEQRQALD